MSIPNKESSKPVIIAAQPLEDALDAANDVWEAYALGHVHGREEGRKDVMAELDTQQKILREKLVQNAFLVAKISQELRKRALEELNLNIDGIVRMRIESPADFTLLFMVREDEFLSETFTKIFSICRSLKQAHNSDTFKIDFSFVCNTKYLDETCIISDGFTYRYREEGKA